MPTKKSGVVRDARLPIKLDSSSNGEYWPLEPSAAARASWRKRERAPTLPPFAIERLPVRFEALWLFSLRVHVVAAALAFPLCLLLATRFLQRRAAVHPVVGRIAGALVLLVLVPSGGVLAFDAKGGAFVTAGFLLSGPTRTLVF